MQRRSRAALAGEIAAWAWTFAAAGGGAWLLATRGPSRLTNGWFAILSGVAACPLTATFARRWLRIPLTAPIRIAAALGFWALGRLALALGL